MVEEDIEQKKRLMRFLWKNGYLVRKNIDLVRYDFGKRTEDTYTDIDVIGINHQFDFQVEKAIAYCTESKTLKSKKLLFWLAGLKDLVDANKAFFVRSEILESRYSDIAQKLGIIPLSTDLIDNLEATYSIDNNLFIGAFNQDCFKKESEAFQNLREIEKKVYSYLKVDYWVDNDPYKKIITLLHSMQLIGNNKGITKENSFFLKMYCMSFLSLTILDFSRPILFIKASDREYQIKERLLGGDSAFTKRKQIEGFYDFMTAEIGKKYRQKYDIPKSGFLEQFYPKYTKYLVDIIERCCNNPRISVYVPNLIDLIAYENGLLGKKIDLKLIKTFYEGNNNEILKKIGKDMLIFAQRSESITEEDVIRASEIMVF